ncbi:hypothetical protein ADK52_31460 [Streptomyces sp. WM6372]|uniref:hypothetical protein n=1 Tax=Streptomyces sp. WM6372 TaxID=1415555 RepID=UPI0006AE273A|nr:hypothetical protein [Streptomyces sp. WM6372]KOU17717.1 hypothetical protein ADK52_31460 [Streptomyces sp. WM6372]
MIHDPRPAPYARAAPAAPAARASSPDSAATSPDAAAGGYYGPGDRFGLVGLVGPTAQARITRRALDRTANARLRSEAERLTGVTTAATR